MPKVVLTLGDDVSTDAVYPGRYMATVLPGETPQFAFADLAEFNGRLRTGRIAPGSVVVAGRNFGCGSSREQAASCLKGYELTVVAKSFARIFLQNAINLGLKVVVAPEVEAGEGDELEFAPGLVVNRSRGASFAEAQLPPARARLIAAGGLVAYTRQRLVERQRTGVQG